MYDGSSWHFVVAGMAAVEGENLSVVLSGNSTCVSIFCMTTQKRPRQSISSQYKGLSWEGGPKTHRERKPTFFGMP